MTLLRGGVAPLAARILLCAIFLQGALGKIVDWPGNVRYMASHGLPLTSLLLGAALVIEAGGSLCVLAGWHARPAALVMAAYLAPVSVVFHDFWNHPGLQQTEFLKNAGVAGGMLMIAAFGPGKIALDRSARS